MTEPGSVSVIRKAASAIRADAYRDQDVTYGPWTPAVAHALAELLDEAAIRHGVYDCEFCADRHPDRLPCPALAVAHAYLGTHPMERPR